MSKYSIVCLCQIHIQLSRQSMTFDRSIRTAAIKYLLFKFFSPFFITCYALYNSLYADIKGKLYIYILLIFDIFSPKDHAFTSLFFTHLFIFFSRFFTEFIPKPSLGINFFPNVSSHKSSLISPYELLFQRWALIYDANGSIGYIVIVFLCLYRHSSN